MPQGYVDPSYSYQAQYIYPQHMQYMNAAPPASPRMAYQPHAQQQYVQAPYGHPPPGQSMSRSSSQISERPNSSLGHPQTPAQPPTTINHGHPPNHGNGSPNPPSTDFKVPPKG